MNFESAEPKMAYYHRITFYCLGKDSYILYCFTDILAEYLLSSALCTYMLAIVESDSNNHAETLKNWQGTEISIEEVGGNTFSVVFPL